MASNSYGAGGWGSDDDVDMAAPSVVMQRPRGRADEGWGGGGGSSRGGGGQSSSRSYPSSRFESSSSSSRPRNDQQDGPLRDGRFDGNRYGMEQHRQPHQNRPFQRRPSPPSSSQRRRSGSPPQASSNPHSEITHGNHCHPHRHKPSARRRRERSSSPPDDGSPALPSNPHPKPSSNAVPLSSTYHPKDISLPLRNLSRTASSSNPNHSNAHQRATASPFSVSSQTVSPPSVTRYSPTFHCGIDITPVPQPRKSTTSSSRPLPTPNAVASSSRLLPPPSSEPTPSLPAAHRKQKKVVQNLSDGEEDVDSPPPKTYDDGFDETESEAEVIDLRGRRGRTDVKEEMEDSGLGADSNDDEVLKIKLTSRPAPAQSKPPPPPHTRRAPPPFPPPQHARASSSSSSKNSIPPCLHSTPPNPRDVKAATAPTSFDPSTNFQPPPFLFAPPSVFQNKRHNPFSRNQNPAQHQQQQQLAHPETIQRWGGGGMSPGATVSLQNHQQQPFFPPSLGNRTPSYGSHENQTPRAAVFGAHQIQWYQEDANGNVVSFSGGGGSMSPDRGSGGGSVRRANGGAGGSMIPPHGGGSAPIAYVNPPQPQRYRSSSSEVKLTYRSLDSYPRLTAVKELEYKERKERCIELLKMVPGPDDRRSLAVHEVETVTWYLEKVNLGLRNKVDLDEDPYFTCENSATFFKGLMGRSEFAGFKAARKELAFLISLQTDRSQIPLGMRPSQVTRVKRLLEDIKTRLDLLEDLISLRHPIFHTPPPIEKGTLLSDEWEKALVKAKRKDAEARANYKLDKDKEQAEKEKGKEKATE